jgi:energy-converting hydrogenase B subunit D
MLATVQNCLVIALTVLMLAGAVCACIFKDLISAVIATAFVSLLAALFFFLLHAPDVAMAEASIGAALTTAIFVIAIKKTARSEEE